MTVVIIPMLTMAVGFLMGVVAMDAYKTSQWQDKMERKMKRLEKRMEVSE